MGICDEKIFEQIFKENNPKVQGYLQARGLDVDQAADMAQEVFVKLWQNCGKVVQSTVMSYVFTSAKNLIIDSSRKAAVRLRYKANVNTPTEKEDPEYLLEAKEFKIKIEKALAEMPPNSREVFVLNRFENMSYKVIAEHMGLSVKAIEKRMSIAIKHLITNEIIKKR